jgi:hypothetical protein
LIKFVGKFSKIFLARIKIIYMSYNLSTHERLFLEKVVDEAHGTKITPDLRENMVNDLGGRLQNHIFASLMQAFPDENKDAMDKFLLTDPTQAETQEFLNNNIPNINEVVASAMLEFRTIYLGASTKN